MFRRYLLYTAFLCFFAAHANAAPAQDRTIEQRIAQLLIVSLDGESLSASDIQMLREWPVGGIVLYKPHLASDDHVRKLTGRIASLTRTVPFIAVDQENGPFQRLPVSAATPPGNMALGAARSTTLAREAGMATGGRLRSLGIQVNFAPVLDVVRNPRSKIGVRSFSDNPKLVAELGKAFIEGQASAGVASVAKHFVGEGSVAGDTHIGTAVLADPVETISANDLLPFREAIAAGVPAIMTSHIGAPALTRSGNTPITYSRRVVTGLLREELGFRGVIMTDAMEMRAARIHTDPGELALWALEAGADMVIIGADHQERRSVFDRLCEAHRNGRLSSTRIDASVARILAFKKRWSGPAPPATQLPDLSLRIAAKALTLVGKLPVLPLRKSAGDVVVLETDEYFGSALDLRSINPATLRIDNCGGSGPPTTDRWRIVVAAFATAGQAEAAMRWIRINAPDASILAVALGDPRDLGRLGRYEAAISVYSACPASRESALRMLTEGMEAPGVMPVQESHIFE